MTMSHSSSDNTAPDNKRWRLTSLQQAWLTEIGLERRTLSYYSARPRPPARPVSADESAIRPHAHLAAAALKQARQGSAVQRPAKSAPDSVVPATPLGQGDSTLLPSDWAALQAHAQDCQACDLQAERDQLVFGVGDTQRPEWLFIGEAPGKADDRTGLPFQGKAGLLLHAMLIALGVYPGSHTLGGAAQPIPAWAQPASMYFANLVKCRPLGNRSPVSSEIASCYPYLRQQIDMLQPGRIVALGRLAAQALLQVDTDIEDLRGKVHTFTTLSGAQIPLIATWHPAALLMHPQNKGQAWSDLNLIRKSDS